jgi:hypothetical protein
MVLPKKLIEKWRLLRSPGDADKIVDIAASQGLEVSDEMVNRYLRTGKCNDELFKIMADFYKEKADLLKEYL